MGILDQVCKANEANIRHIKAFVHGNSGAGKSTLCGTMPGKILYLWTERQGVISFQRMAPEGDVLEIDSLATLTSVFMELKRSENCGGYDSVVLDSLTEMQQLVIKEVSGKRKSLTFQDWGDITTKTTNVVRAYRDLPANVLVTSLTEEFDISDNKSVYRPMLAGKKLPATIPQYFNLVGYAYKSGDKDKIKHLVLLDGSTRFVTKSQPGLRYIEDPDVTYWYNRIFTEEPSRDTDAPMTPFPEWDNMSHVKDDHVEPEENDNDFKLEDDTQ